MIIANTVGIIKKKTIGKTFLTSAYTKQGIKIISSIILTIIGALIFKMLKKGFAEEV